jgi:hypothetical protein
VPAIETAVQADRDESRLAGHEARPLDHQRQELSLPALLRFGDRNLRDEVAVGPDLWH